MTRKKSTATYRGGPLDGLVEPVIGTPPAEIITDTCVYVRAKHTRYLPTPAREWRYFAVGGTP